MSDQLEIIQVQTSDLVYQQDKAQIDIQISTAKAFPRNIKRSIDNAIAIVTLDKDTASSCTYALPRSGKNISGPTVHLAKILAQSWGNMRIEAKVTDIGDRQITSQAVAFDLENNIAIKVEVKRSIMTHSGKMNNDMITVTGNAANAIALRNAIFSVVPKNVVDKVYNSALDTITGDLSDEDKFIKRRKEFVDFFQTKYGVSDVEVFNVFGKTEITQLTREDLVTLHGIQQAIKDGDTTVTNTFRKAGPTTEIKEKDARSQLQIIIEDDVDSIEFLKSLENKIETKEEQVAYDTKLKSLEK